MHRPSVDFLESCNIALNSRVEDNLAEVAVTLEVSQEAIIVGTSIVLLLL